MGQTVLAEAVGTTTSGGSASCRRYRVRRDGPLRPWVARARDRRLVAVVRSQGPPAARRHRTSSYRASKRLQRRPHRHPHPHGLSNRRQRHDGDVATPPVRHARSRRVAPLSMSGGGEAPSASTSATRAEGSPELPSDRGRSSAQHPQRFPELAFTAGCAARFAWAGRRTRKRRAARARAGARTHLPGRVRAGLAVHGRQHHLQVPPLWALGPQLSKSQRPWRVAWDDLRGPGARSAAECARSQEDPEVSDRCRSPQALPPAEPEPLTIRRSISRDFRASGRGPVNLRRDVVPCLPPAPICQLATNTLPPPEPLDDGGLRKSKTCPAAARPPRGWDPFGGQQVLAPYGFRRGRARGPAPARLRALAVSRPAPRDGDDRRQPRPTSPVARDSSRVRSTDETLRCLSSPQLANVAEREVPAHLAGGHARPGVNNVTARRHCRGEPPACVRVLQAARSL